MSPRVLLLLGLACAVAVVLLGMRFRIMMAGGKAIFVLAIIGVLVWVALRPRRQD